MADRMTRLLTEAAEAMADGRDPFDRSFLVEHGVTLDEVYDLSETIALAVKSFLAAQQYPALLVALLANQIGGRDVARAAMVSSLMSDVTGELRRLTP